MAPSYLTNFVLVHSPLAGPLTWALVANELHQKGFEALMPSLREAQEASRPYWKQHVDAVIRTMERLPTNQRFVLVGHSGAGVLLPAIRDRIARAISGYVFVDAPIPENGKSRFDLMDRESGDAVDQLRQRVREGYIAPWTEGDLRGPISDPTLRRQFVAELRPVPLAAYEEPIPVFEGWPDAPCGYLLFSSIYRVFADQAQRAGWPYAEIPGGHLDMLVDPVAVTDGLIDLVERMGVDLGQKEAN